MKPKILFVTEKWRDANPNSPLTNNFHNLFGSLEHSELATQDKIHFDEYFHVHKKPCDEYLIKYTIESKPDLIMFCFIPWYEHIPKIKTISILSNYSKLVFVYPDAIWGSHLGMAKQFDQYATMSILWDCDYSWEDSHNLIHLWTPQDPRIYYNPRIARDIDVSFVGSINYNDRSSTIKYLRENNINVLTFGGQKKLINVEEYAKIIQRSKISLNFSLNLQGIEQLKGRIFEVTNCGALLMESKHKINWIERWLYPMIHYVPFDNHIDLKDKIKYYLHNESEREKIAENGWRKTLECYSNVAWWSYVLKESGVT